MIKRRTIYGLALLLAGIVNALAWDSMSFDIPSGSKESLWRDALARKVGGITEMKIKVGRMDVTTANEVYEVDWIHNWKEGMGQVLAYTGETGKQPVLALISYSQGASNLTTKTKATLDQAETECARHEIRLLVLFPTLPESPHPYQSRSKITKSRSHRFLQEISTEIAIEESEAAALKCLKTVKTEASA